MTNYDIASFPKKLTKIDEITVGDHHHLTGDDECFYIGDYTAQGGYACSSTNNLIINLKMPMSKRDTPRWRYKQKAIRVAGAALGATINAAEVTFIPAPSSKKRTDPEYDDRVCQVLRAGFPLAQLDLREVFATTENRASYHDGGSRDVQGLMESWDVSQQLLNNLRQHVVVFDDMITTGCHFRAMKNLLSAYVPAERVVGIFLARRAIKSDFEALFSDN